MSLDFRQFNPITQLAFERRTLRIAKRALLSRGQSPWSETHYMPPRATLKSIKCALPASRRLSQTYFAIFLQCIRMLHVGMHNDKVANESKYHARTFMNFCTTAADSTDSASTYSDYHCRSPNDQALFKLRSLLVAGVRRGVATFRATLSC